MDRPVADAVPILSAKDVVGNIAATATVRLTNCRPLLMRLSRRLVCVP